MHPRSLLKSLSTSTGLRHNLQPRRGRYFTSIEVREDSINIPALHSSFPYVWLRDSCQCPSCVHPSTRQKLHRSSDFAAGARPASAKAVTGGLRVEWAPKHISFYPAEFLARYSSRHNISAFHREVQPTPWTAEHFAGQSREDISIPYTELSKAESHLLVYTSLLRYGLVFLRGVPVDGASDESCELRVLAGRLGAIRKTFYGETWDVKNIRNSKNIAYTNLDLGLHMDLLYFKEPPRYQILHCIRNRVRGGQSIFVDALQAAQQLYSASPGDHTLLVETPVPFHYINDGHHLHYSHPTLELTNDTLTSVNYSPPFQAPFLSSTPLAFYRALATFSARLEDPGNCFTYLLREGDAVVFDNRRVLHGRTAFVDDTPASEEGEANRWLKGCYLEEDPVRDRMRTLSATIGKTDR
ncbi:hypothetical protein M0805_005502 [Coniferiporia weirii]|nr:hypothetical protein M0805_005502 [Coniferiporia weirii]